MRRYRATLFVRSGVMSSKRSTAKAVLFLGCAKPTSLTRCYVGYPIDSRPSEYFPVSSYIFPVYKVAGGFRITEVWILLPYSLFWVRHVAHREVLVDTAIRLPPEGIPGRNRKWIFPEGFLLSEYDRFLSKVFARTVPTPISGCRRS